MSRSVSTISDEIKRNTVKGEYDPKKAQHKAYARRKYARYQGRKVAESAKLKTFVNAQLKAGQSPEAIAGRLHHEELPFVSKDSIYRYLKSVHGRQIEAYLANQKKKRGWRKRRKQRAKLSDRTFIDQRPSIINERKRIGDVEADFVVSGRNGKGILLVVADRKTRAVFIARINKISVAQVHRSFRWIQKRFPEMKSVTTDNDILFQKHDQLEKLLGVPIYFCDPYSSWQKGAVENVNKHIRKYIPKGSDISQYSRYFVDQIEKKLNGRFLKCLRFKTPKEALEKHRKQKITR